MNAMRISIEIAQKKKKYMYGQLQNFLTGFFLRIPNELRLSWDFSMDSTKNFYKDSTSNSSRDLFKGYPSKLSTYCLTNENSSD